MPPRGKDIRRVALWGGKVLLAALLLLLIFDSIEAHSLLALLRSAQPLLLLAALLLLPLNLWLQLRKWRLLVHSRFPGIPSTDLRVSLLLGFTFGIVTPARIGEFGGRAAGFRGAGMRRADLLTLAGLTAVDKFATMLVTVAIGVPGLVLFSIFHPFLDASTLAVVLAAAVLLAALGLYLLRGGAGTQGSALPAGQSHKANAGHRIRLLRSFDELRETVRGVDRSRRLRLLGYSGLFYLTFLLQFYLLLSAFGPVHPLSALAGILTIMLVKTVIPPVTLGELGIREGASVIVLGHAGIVPAAAFNASLLLFAVNLLIPALAGLVLLLAAPSARSKADAMPDDRSARTKHDGGIV